MGEIIYNGKYRLLQPSLKKIKKNHLYLIQLYVKVFKNIIRIYNNFY